MAQLEREGFVRSVPRRGVYVVRKTKKEVIEMITAWASLESMAARLITERVSTDEIATLRRALPPSSRSARRHSPSAARPAARPSPTTPAGRFKSLRQQRSTWWRARPSPTTG